MSNIRQTILLALEDRLQTITVANGYATNIGAEVFLWRTSPAREDEMPCLLVYDKTLDRKYDGAANTRVENQINIAVVVCAAQNENGLQQARTYEADVVKCLGDWDLNPELAEWLYIPKTELVNEEHNLSYWAVLLTVVIEYDSDYNQI